MTTEYGRRGCVSGCLKLATACAVAAVTFASVPAEASQVSFVSIGDWGGAGLGGYHETDEVTVAKSFSAKASALDAQFVLNTGDNFYYYGVKSTDDPMWKSTFEDIYTDASMMVKWYGVLGNHDYGFNATAQTAYRSPNKDRWVLPSPYYTRRLQLGSSDQHVTLIMIDTSPCVADCRGTDKSLWDPCGTEYPGPADCQFHKNILQQNCTEQAAWLKETMGKIPKDDWKIAVGHHPADEIDVEDLTSLLQDGKIDLYLNGHTHEMARYSVDNNGAFLTTGGGCMVKVSAGGHQEPPYNHAEKLAAANRKTMEVEVPTTLVDAESLGMKEPKHVGNNDHQYKSIWHVRSAGFTTHTFSEDMQSLTTNVYDGNGNELEKTSFTVKKGQAPSPSPGPGPSPGPSPGPTPAPGTKCCYYDEAKTNPDCHKGAVCCKSHCADPSTCSYSKEGCGSKYGQKHSCEWNSKNDRCEVGTDYEL